METTKRQAAGHAYIIWLTTVIAAISALLIVALAIYTYATMLPEISQYQGSLKQTEDSLNKVEAFLAIKNSSDMLPPESFSVIDTLLKDLGKSTFISVKSAEMMLPFLMGAIILTLILLLSQAYMWSKDRRKLELWRESGFLCERLEFLPANRLRLNNIELELNKTQIDNLIKIAKSRKQGKPIHTLDIGDHGAQSTNRLREELGKKFIERSLIKHRKQEGYWLEVDPERIYFQTE